MSATEAYLIERGAPALGRRASAPSRRRGLPELAPAELPMPDEAGTPARPRMHLTRRSAADEATDFRARPERRDPVARLTVYALNGVIMLMAFPLGFALLIFNILGGENLRTTLHATALAGLASALTGAGYAVQAAGIG